jgi:hypothetical protein
MNVLVACEFSGIVTTAFRKLGHIAYYRKLRQDKGYIVWSYSKEVYAKLTILHPTIVTEIIGDEK